jgi:hypothetical protein
VDDHASSCAWCKATLSAASDLRFKKLGKHERHQLLAAASPTAAASPIVALGSSQADQTATRRAIKSLRDAGLIRLSDETRRVTADSDAKLLRRLHRKYAVLRFMWRTELGEAVATEYRPELDRPGSRIRWQTGRLDAVRDRALEACPLRH